MLGERDRQEDDQDIEMALQVLALARGRFETLPGSLGRSLPGSILHEERRYTAREPIEFLVATHRSRALENLEQLFRVMYDEATNIISAYPYSLYSLLRASVESAATALWLIKSDRKNHRVLRALQLSYRDAQDRFRFIEMIAPTTDVEDERKRVDAIVERLTELKNLLPPLRQTELGNPPKYTEILKSVSPRDPGRAGMGYSLSSPFVIWKVASAFIHGSDDVVKALSDLRQTGEFEEGIASFEVTPSFRMLAGSAMTCANLLKEVDDRYVRLSRFDYAGRPVMKKPAP